MKKKGLVAFGLLVLIVLIGFAGYTLGKSQNIEDTNRAIESLAPEESKPIEDDEAGDDGAEVKNLSAQDDEGEDLLYTIFEIAYDEGQSRDDAGYPLAFNNLNERIDYELSEVVSWAESCDFTLPDDYIQLYLDWRPGGIGDYGKEIVQPASNPSRVPAGGNVSSGVTSSGYSEAQGDNYIDTGVPDVNFDPNSDPIGGHGDGQQHGSWSGVTQMTDGTGGFGAPSSGSGGGLVTTPDGFTYKDTGSGDSFADIGGEPIGGWNDGKQHESTWSGVTQMTDGTGGFGN